MLCSCDCHLTGWFAQPTAIALQHHSHLRHKGQFAPGLFRVVGMFHLLILFVCMWMQFALHMGLFSDGLFFTTASDVLSIIPQLDGHCSAAAFASNAAASAPRSFLPLPRICVAACWCVGFLCPHSNVPLFHFPPSERMGR